MALDDDKAALGRAAQAEPAKIGRLKQLALDRGITTEELIFLASDKLSPEAEPTRPNADVEGLKAEVKELQRFITSFVQQRQAPPPPPDMMAQFTGFMSLVEGIKKIFPQQGFTDMLAQIDALDKVRAKLYGPDEDEAPEREDGPEASLARMVMGAIEKSQSQGQQQPSASMANSPPQHTPAAVSNAAPGDVHVEKAQGEVVAASAAPPPAPQKEFTETRGDVHLLSEKEVEEWAAKVPQEARQAIKSGKLSLEEAKAQVRPLLAKYGVSGVSDEDIARVYEEVRQG